MNFPNHLICLMKITPLLHQLQNIWQIILKNYQSKLKKKKIKKISILEIGCNDGVFLENFKNSTHLGVEPSKNVYKLSKKRKLNVDNSFFNYEYIKK